MCIVHAQTNMNTGSSASSSSEYTNSGSADEILLESYFNNLAGFRYDEAKDICVREHRKCIHCIVY